MNVPDRGLDLRSVDEATVAEADAFRAFYAERYGRSHAGLNFWLDNERPGVLKRYRALALAMSRDSAGNDRSGFEWTTYYPAIGFTEYVPRQVHMLQEAGLTRDEILGLYGIAFLDVGPHGMETIALGLKDYEWRTPTSRYRWPSGWEPDPAVLRTGIDFSSTDLLPGELDAIEQWHMRLEGEIPGYVTLLGRFRPTVLKAYRNRVEHAVELPPVQVLPSLLLHHALLRGSSEVARENVLLARGIGMRFEDVIWVASSTALYGVSPLALLESAAGDVLDSWPAE
jgi:hypothetical protein